MLSTKLKWPISHSEQKHIILLYSTASCMVSFGYLSWNKSKLEEKYIIFRILHSAYKLHAFRKFSYLGDHALPTKLRSECCPNDLNHFQLKV